MNKAEAICKLHEIAEFHLLHSGGWPASREATSAFRKTIRDFGLEEDVHDGFGSTRSTPLGKEVSVDLMMVFAGCWEMWEIPCILAEGGYIDWDEAEELWTRPSFKVERRIRILVLRAYLDFCGQTKRPN
jgi:hypothetical protein